MKHSVTTLAFGVASLTLIGAMSSTPAAAFNLSKMMHKVQRDAVQLASLVAQSAPEQPAYSCEEANRIKNAPAEYDRLPSGEKLIIRTTALNCEVAEVNKLAQETGQPDQVQRVVVATKEDGSVLFGLAKESDLLNAKKNCTGAAAYTGIAITVAGTFSPSAPIAPEIGTAIYEYGGVACNALGDAIASGNPILVLSPGTVVGAAVVGQTIKQVVHELGIRGDVGRELTNLGTSIQNAPARGWEEVKSWF